MTKAKNIFVTVLVAAVWALALAADFLRHGNYPAYMNEPIAVGVGIGVAFFAWLFTAMWRSMLTGDLGLADKWAILSLLFFGLLFAVWRHAMGIMALTLAGLAARHYWQKWRLKTDTD